MPRSSIRRLAVAGAAWIAAQSIPFAAHAADPPASADPPPPGPAAEPPPPATDSEPAPASVHSEERKNTIEPLPVVEPTHGPITFAADPIADGGIIIGATAFAGILELINSTGEIRPQQISPTFDRSHLLWIDRGSVTLTPSKFASTSSTIGLAAAAGFAVLDPILTGVRTKRVQAALVDGLIYAEALSITWGVTNLAKMAVRRPRPRAYIEADQHKNDPNYSNSDTDSTLSFFSGHASLTAAVSATATYLAFARYPDTALPWVTLGVGTALTTFVSIERVEAGAHFPTDVIAGAIAGAGIGVIVTHLHRNQAEKERRIWVGFAPEREQGGSVQLSGIF